jgi:hypothetical protein
MSFIVLVPKKVTGNKRKVQTTSIQEKEDGQIDEEKGST